LASGVVAFSDTSTRGGGGTGDLAPVDAPPPHAIRSAVSAAPMYLG